MRWAALFAFLWTGDSAHASTGPGDLLADRSPPDPSLATGGLVREIDLGLPAGPAGLAPQVRLQANQAVVDGPLGRGWNLTGLSRIERRGAREGVPVFASDDVFVVDGVALAEDASSALPGCPLRLSRDDNRCFEYDPDADLWTARRDGWTWTWGEPDEEGWGVCATESIDEDASTPCTSNPGIGDAASSTGWLLSKVEDPHGNEVKLNYVVPTGCPARGCGVLDADFAYTHLVDHVTWAGGTLRLDFAYGGRPDERSSGRSGRIRHLIERLEAIALTGGSTALATWDLTWLDEATVPCTPGGDLEVALGGQSTLQRIAQVGADRDRTLACMETGQVPVSFDLDVDEETGEGGVDPLVEWPEGGLYDEPVAAQWVVLNLDGDPWPDLGVVALDCSPTDCSFEHHAWVNREDGSGQLDEDAALTTFLEQALGEDLVGGGQDPEYPEFGWVMADLDRDGRDEVLTAGDTLPGPLAWSYDPLTETGSSSSSWIDVEVWELAQGVPVDVNGDGWLDLLVPDLHGTSPRWIPNAGAPPYWSSDEALDLLLPTDPGTEAGDALADLADACALAGGQFDPTSSVDILSEAEDVAGIPYSVERDTVLQQTRWADANGDGLVDMVVLLHGCWSLDGSEAVSWRTDDDWSFSRIFYGDGAGGFSDTGLPGGYPVFAQRRGYFADPVPSTFDLDAYWSENYCVDEGNADAQLFATSSTWTMLDLDRDGSAELVDGYAEGGCTQTRLGATPNLGFVDGFGIETPGMGSYDWEGPATFSSAGCAPWTGGALTAAGDAAFTELPFHAFSATWPARHALLPADWDGDGFVDLLRIRSPTLDEPLGEEIGFTAGLYLNALEQVPGRLQSLVGSYGGRTELEYSFADPADNPDLPFLVEVVSAVTDGAGLSERSFFGGAFEEGRFLGFRDALVVAESGRVETMRYALAEAIAGDLVWHAARRPDLSLETLRVLSKFSSAHGNIDTVAPWFNPTRRRCDFWVEAGELVAGEVGQSVGIEELVDICRSALSSNDDADLWAELGWGEDESWGPPLPGPTAPTFSALDASVWPSAMAVPSTPTADPGYGDGSTGHRLQVTDFDHHAWQRLEETTHHRDAATTSDDVLETRSFGSWDTTAMGPPVTSLAWSVPGGSPFLTRSRSSFGGDFDTPEVVTESAGLSSRVWNYTWSSGELATSEDPLGGVKTWTRNDCGRVVTYEDPAGRVETSTWDAGCRELTRSFEGGLTTWAYDDFGRVASRTVDAGGGSEQTTRWAYADALAVPDDRTSGSEPRIGVNHGEGLIELHYLDPWGRTFRQTRCAGEASASEEGSVEDVAMACSTTSTDPLLSMDTWRARDGSVRLQTAPYGRDALGALQGQGGSTAVVPTTWTWADPFGRGEVRQDPAPVPVGPSFSPTWTTTRWRYAPGQTVETDPGAVQCTLWYSTLSQEAECAANPRGLTRFDRRGRVFQVEDAEGVTESVLYDDFGRPSQRVLDRSIETVGGLMTPSRSFTWDDLDRMVTATDPAGNVHTWEYDPIGRPEVLRFDDALTSASLVLSEWVWTDGSGPSVEIVDIDGNATVRSMDGLGRVALEELPDGTEVSRTWNVHGLLATITDVDGIEHAWTHDALGRSTTLSRAGTTVRSWSWASDGRLSATADGDEVETTTEWTYDGRVRAVRRTRAGASPWMLGLYDYDSRGRRTTVFEDGVGTKWEYDDLGRPTRARLGWDGSGGGSSLLDLTWEWTDADRVATSTRGSLVTDYTWNAVGWLTDVVHPGGSSPTETYEYDAVGNVAAYFDEEGVLSEWEYDGLGRVLHERLPGQGWRGWTYTQGIAASSVSSDLVGNLTEVWRTEPDDGDWVSFLDFAGRMVRSESPDNRAVESLFQGSQLHTRKSYGYSAELLAVESWGYDAQGRTSWHWWPVEASTWTSQAGVPASSDTYDSFTWSDAGRMSERQGPNDLTVWTWQDGEVVTEDIDGITTRTHGYHSFYPRRTSTTETGTTTRAATWTWDRGLYLTSAQTTEGGVTRRVEYSNYDVHGTARRIQNKRGSTIEVDVELQTDDRGRVDQRKLTIGGAWMGTANFGFADNGKLEGVVMDWSGGGHDELVYRYAGADMELDEIEHLGSSTVVASFPSRDDLGRPTSIALGSGSAQIDTTWDYLGRVDTQAITAPSSGTTTRTWTYDGRGRVVERTIDGISDLYSYQEPGWLTEEVQDAGEAGERTQVYGYDAAGNRVNTESYEGSTWVSTVAYDYDAGNVLVERDDGTDVTTYDWDEHGALTEDERSDLAFVPDADGLLREVRVASTSSLLLSLLRDGSGRAVQSTDGSGARKQLWGHPDGGLPVASREADGSRVLTIQAEGLLLGKIEDGALVAMANDASGNLALADDALLPRHGAWGDALLEPTTTGAPQRYAGMEHLPSLEGYELAGARLYHPETGRFTSPDPLGQVGTSNRFVYALNDPLGLWDPSGLCPEVNLGTVQPFGAPVVGVMGSGGRDLLAAPPPSGSAVGGRVSRIAIETSGGVCDPAMCGPEGPGDEEAGEPGGGGRSIAEELADRTLMGREEAGSGLFRTRAERQQDRADRRAEREARRADGRGGGRRWTEDVVFAGAEVTVIGTWREGGLRGWFGRVRGGLGGRGVDPSERRSGWLAGALDSGARAAAGAAVATSGEYLRDSATPVASALLSLGYVRLGVDPQSRGSYRQALDAVDANASAWLTEQARAADQANPTVAEVAGGATLLGMAVGDALVPGAGGEAKLAAKALDEGLGVASRGGGVTTLHRAVGRAELADIKATGQLRAGPGMEGKWFAEKADDAATWGNTMDFGGKPTVIEADFPTSTVDDMFRVEKLDGIGPARYAEEAQFGDCCAIRVPE